MSDPPFRYLVTDLRTGATVAELPLFDVSFRSLLNGAGPMSASLRLPSDDPDLAEAYVDATAELRRVVYIVHDGHVLWAGPIWNTDYNTRTQTLTIQGAELWSYWRRRLIRWDASFVGIDQRQIAWSLLRTAQQQAGGDIRMTVRASGDDVPRDRSYLAQELKQVGEAVEQLAAVDNGFDFVVEVVRDPWGGWRRRLSMAYPERTRPVSESGLYLTLGNNMLDLRLPRKGTDAANSIDTIGAGQGVDMLRYRAVDTDMLAAGYPLLEQARTYKDISRLSTLVDHAIGELTASKRPVSLPTATVLVEDHPHLGSYQLGDQALLQVMPGTEPRWPSGLALEARLTAIDVRPPDDGEPATVDLIFEEIAS